MASHLRHPVSDAGDERTPGEQRWHAPVRVWEDEDRYYLEMDLPGVSKDHLELTIQDGVLRIAAERQPTRQPAHYRYQDRPYGYFERTFRLPERVDPDSIEAEMADGVLTVRLDKPAHPEPRRIPINVS